MEVAELPAEDDAVTKEGLSGQGKTDQKSGGHAVSNKKEEEMKESQPRVTYSKEDLLNLRESPASKLWPSILSEEYVRHGVWDPEVWHQSFSGKRCGSPGEELKKQLVIEDGIVLSPQRQSFMQGCHIPQSAPERNNQQDRGKGGLSRTTDREREGRSRLTGRVGRGRALDYKERTPLQERNKDPDELPGKYTGPREREERGDRAERGFNKDKDRGFRDRDKERKRSREEPTRGRNIQVRKKQAKETQNEEPEWFTCGPSSQFETMELKGFDDDVKRDRERRKSASDEIKAILSVGKKRPTNGELNSRSPVTDTSASQDSTGAKRTVNTKDSAEGAAAADDSKDKARPFDINDFFLSDSLLNFTGGVDQASSRFSQFFGQPGSNYSSSRSGSTGFSSGGANTPRTPSPGPNYLFTPIAPSAEDAIESNNLANMMQKSKISVQPLLDEVMSSGNESKVKGSVRLEDIEADVTKDLENSKKEISSEVENKENINKESETANPGQEMVAFNMLVEKMKSSGTLPEKPQPTITGLPTRLLPRPPSPKRKSPRNTPSPLHDLRRSPSSAELLKQMTMQAPLSHHRPPSPAQVVPQMNRPPSPLEMFHKYNSIVTPPHDLFASPLLRRSPSPLAMLAHQRQSPPLGFGSVNMQRVPPQMAQLYHTGPHSGMPRMGSPQQPPVRKPQPQEKYTRGGAPEPRSHPKPASGSHSGSPHIPDRSFMPTSVMRKIHQDHKTPKANGEDQSKARSLKTEGEPIAKRTEGAPEVSPVQSFMGSAYHNSSMPRSEGENDLVKMGLFQQYTEERPSPTHSAAGKQDLLLSPRSIRSSDTQLSQSGSPVLQKPTAFKPLPGSPQLPFSSLKGSIHSEPAIPQHFNQSAGSPLRAPKPLPNSAPCTPQRHPLVDKAALLSPQQLASKGLMTRDDKPLSGLFGHSSSLEGQAKGIRNGITRVVAANEGRPLTHSYEQQPHVISDKPSAYEDVFHAKRSEGLSSGHPAPQHHQNSVHGIHRMNSSEGYHENLPANHPHRILGDSRPSPVHHNPRSFHGSQGPRPGPHVPNGRMSPSGMAAMHGGHPGRTPFNSPMPGMGVPPRSGMHPGMIPPHLHPAYMRMMSQAGTPMGMQSPGMNPVPMRMPMPHSAGRVPMMPGHHPAAAAAAAAMMYGGRPSPGYPPVNPAAMMAARSPHVHPQSGLQQMHARRVASPVMNHPPQSNSPVGSGNILSKWFSEDVLQQVTPAQREVAADFSRKLLSVEELERQQAAAMN